MNAPEAMVLVLCAILLAVSLVPLCRRGIHALLLTVAVAPALFLSLETASQFLTVDEIYIIRETADLDFHYMVQWYTGVNRTTETAMGVVSRIVRTLFAPSDDQLKMTLKLARFILAFLVLLLIHRLTWQRVAVAGTAAFACWTVLFFYAALLLPLSALSLRIFNYDCLSMYLGALSLLLIATALEQKSRRRAIAAVACAYLASQEKSVTAPILMFCLAAFGIVFTDTRRRTAPLVAALHAPLGVAVAFATGLACVFLVGLAGSGDFPRSFLGRIVDPLALSMIDVLLRFAWGLPELGAFTYSRAFLIMGIAPLLAAAASALLLAGYRLAKRLSVWRMGGVVPSAKLAVTTSLIALCAGMAGTFLVHHHFQYFTTGDTLPFIHTAPFNNIVSHYGAVTPAHHLLSSIGYAYAVFVNAVPTVFWIMLLASGLYAWRCSATPGRWYEHAVVLAVCCVPLAWGTIQMPIGNRYFNLFVFLLALYSCMQFTRLIAPLKRKTAATLAVSAVCLLVLEVLPFRPVYAAFRPFWSSFQDTIPQKGRGNPVWVGWGEEVMLAARAVEKMFVLSPIGHGQKPVLYCFYPGDCLTWSGATPCSIKLVMKDSSYLNRDVERFMHAMGKATVRSAVTYDSTDLFLFNRFNFILDDYPFPVGVTPLYMLSWRGYPMAWLYRGDALKKSGFTLK